jgi:hypothetical protein
MQLTPLHIEGWQNEKWEVIAQKMLKDNEIPIIEHESLYLCMNNGTNLWSRDQLDAAENI